MEVKVKKLDPNATIPQYKTTGSSGLDLVASAEVIEVDKGYLEYKTGIAIEIPAGFEGQIRPRSSIRDKDLTLVNSPGTIDSDYRGEITVTFKPTRPKARKYAVGERIAQLVIVPIVQVNLIEVTALDNTQRGAGGWGSTGTK